MGRSPEWGLHQRLFERVCPAGRYCGGRDLSPLSGAESQREGGGCLTGDQKVGGQKPVFSDPHFERRPRDCSRLCLLMKCRRLSFVFCLNGRMTSFAVSSPVI